MNPLQRGILALGLILVAGMAVCPPWEETRERGDFKRTTAIGYHFIGFPPESKSSTDSVGIDVDRLTAQILAVSVVVCPFILVLPIADCKKLLQVSARLVPTRTLLSRVLRWTFRVLGGGCIFVLYVLSKEVVPPSFIAGGIRAVLSLLMFSLLWKVTGAKPDGQKPIRSSQDLNTDSQPGRIDACEEGNGSLEAGRRPGLS